MTASRKFEIHPDDDRSTLVEKIKHTALLLANLYADEEMLKGMARSSFLNKELAKVEENIHCKQDNQLKSYFEHLKWKYNSRIEKLESDQQKKSYRNELFFNPPPAELEPYIELEKINFNI